MMHKGFVIMLMFIAASGYCNSSYAQSPQQEKDKPENFVLYFRFDKVTLERGYRGNAQSLADLDALLRDSVILSSLDSIQVMATASPEGNFEHNRRLAQQRSKAVKGYIVWKYPKIDQHLIHTHSIDENWSGLQRLVEADSNVPYRDKVLQTIHTTVNPATKEWRLRQIGGGEAWRYIERTGLSDLRSGTTCVVFYPKAAQPAPEPMLVPEPTPAPTPTPESAPAPVQEPTPAPESASPPPAAQDPVVEYIRKPLFAIKTNLLFDAATALNIELEVPIGKRWSVSGEWMFPWWQAESSNWTMQILTGHAAVKYWFGNREKREVLCGWSVGVYGGGGKYDLQFFDKNGIQGEFFDVGIQCGFAHKIGKSWRMEYLLGLGYLQSDYKKYDKVLDTRFGNIKVFRFPWETKQRGWFGPTSAKISLVYLLHYKTTKKGGRVK